jgi:hypothetical protein
MITFDDPASIQRVCDPGYHTRMQGQTGSLPRGIFGRIDQLNCFQETH